MNMLPENAMEISFSFCKLCKEIEKETTLKVLKPYHPDHHHHFQIFSVLQY